MRYVTEANAKLIEEVLQQQIADLKAINSKSLRLANRIRLTEIALRDLIKNKTIKNGKINSKQG
nr:MAG TPA: hypothetical protein [Caudoviricetes sp.]